MVHLLWLYHTGSLELTQSDRWVPGHISSPFVRWLSSVGQSPQGRVLVLLNFSQSRMMAVGPLWRLQVLVSSAQACHEAEWWEHPSSACGSLFPEGKVETDSQRGSTGQEA